MIRDEAPVTTGTRAFPPMLLAILAAGVVIRLAYLFAVPDSWYLHEEVSPLAESYQFKVRMFEETADNILAGRGYVVYSRYLKCHVSYLFLYPPGFSLLLAAMFRVGIRSHLAIQLLQVALALVSYLLVCRIASSIASRRAVFITAALISLSPILARSDVAIDPCVPGIFLVSAALCLLTAKSGRIGLRWSLAGALMGVTGLFFQDFAGLPAFLFLAVAAAMGIRFLARYGSLFLVFYLAGSSPLMAVYYRELGRIALSPPATGAGMMLGIGQFGGTGDLYMPATFWQAMEYEGTYETGRKYPREAGEDVLMYYPNARERDSVRRAHVMSFVREHPGFVAREMLKKVPRMFAGNITGITPRELDARARYYGERAPRCFTDRAAEWGCRAAAAFFRCFPLVEWSLALMALGGICLAVSRRRSALVVAAVPAYLFLAHLPLVFEPRMMTPALPFIYVFAAVFLDRASRRWENPAREANADEP